jgi:hypothetical protein
VATQLEIWLARNLGFLAAMVVVAGVVVWPIILWTTPFSVEAAFCLAGFFLLVCYWRYPRLPFRLPPLLFWGASVVFIPLWVSLRLPAKIIHELFGWPDATGSPFRGLLIAAAIFPIAHILFSLAGLAVYLYHRSRPKT